MTHEWLLLCLLHVADFLARGFLSFFIMHHLLQRNVGECCQCEIPTVSTLFLLRLASFLVSAMGFPAECCTFLFKEITCSDFYQHGTPNGFVFFSVFSVPSCKWDCFHCWMVYKEKLTVHSVSWTHEGFSSWYFSECRSCSVVLFPRYTRKYSPAVHTNWLSFWSGVHFGLLVLVSLASERWRMPFEREMNSECNQWYLMCFILDSCKVALQVRLVSLFLPSLQIMQ